MSFTTKHISVLVFFKPNFHITLYQTGTLAQLQLNMRNHVLALCAFYKELSISLPESMSSTLSTTVPYGTGTLHLQLLFLKLRMTASFSL
jgi:hypothetical protein